MKKLFIFAEAHRCKACLDEEISKVENLKNEADMLMLEVYSDASQEIGQGRPLGEYERLFKAADENGINIFPQVHDSNYHFSPRAVESGEHAEYLKTLIETAYAKSEKGLVAVVGSNDLETVVGLLGRENKHIRVENLHKLGH